MIIVTNTKEIVEFLELFLNERAENTLRLPYEISRETVARLEKLEINAEVYYDWDLIVDENVTEIITSTYTLLSYK